MKNETAEKRAVQGNPAGAGVNAASHAASISSAEEYGRITGQRRAADGVMKELLKNARFTGALLAALLRELEGETLDDFCRHTGADVLTGSSLGGLATEVGSLYTKDIRLDLVFEHAAAGMMLRINEEAQTKQKSFQERNLKSYPLTARAVYYASLAVATQLQAIDEYHKIRKAYSVWLCYERPVPDMREPVIRYSLRPEEEYKYKDGTPLTECRRKYDSGDLMGIVLVSVPDVERVYGDSALLHSGKYSEEMITELYYLLSEKTDSRQRKQYYYDRGIIKRGSEEGNMVSAIEELKQAAENERRNMTSVMEELKQAAENERRSMTSAMEELKQSAEDERKWKETFKRKAEESERKAGESARKLEESKKKASEAERAVVSLTVNMGKYSGLDIQGQISMIAEQLKIGTEEAGELYRVYSGC